jgi:uncharacterized protein involved in exopolysaccharide biosynthesis
MTATLANEQLQLNSDITAFKNLISRIEGVEAPRILSMRPASPTRPSRHATIAIGAALGLLAGLLAAILWQPITRARHTPTPAP